MINMILIVSIWSYPELELYNIIDNNIFRKNFKSHQSMLRYSYFLKQKSFISWFVLLLHWPYKFIPNFTLVLCVRLHVIQVQSICSVGVSDFALYYIKIAIAFSFPLFTSPLIRLKLLVHTACVCAFALLTLQRSKLAKTHSNKRAQISCHTVHACGIYYTHFTHECAITCCLRPSF